MSKHKDLTGEKFSNLLVISLSGKRRGRYMWECECDCGTRISVRGDALTTGNTISCGCVKIKRASELNATHKMSKTRLYNIWTGIKARCYNPNSSIYKHYGRRGISMCCEWKNSFIIFFEWAINNGYSRSLSIDRIDVDGDYVPDNCRWVTQKEQILNTRKNRNIKYLGETYPLCIWAKITGIPRETIAHRLDRGWSAKRALSIGNITPTAKPATEQ